MILMILLIAHLLADFTLQTTDLAKKKMQKLRYLFGHVIIYALVIAVAIFVAIPRKIGLLPYMIIVASHLIIDWIRIATDKKNNKPSAHFASFVIDQILHVTALWGVVFAFKLDNHYSARFLSWVQQFPLDDYLRYSLLFVIIWDPASVFVKKLSLYIDGKSDTPAPTLEAPVGSIIGKMERLIISILVLCNEIGAIGFVLTAKSLARYKQLSEKGFAEKYLVGTLTSTAIAIIAALLFK